MHKGDTYFFWHDLWGGSVHSQILPELYSFSRTKNVSIAKASATESLAQLFSLPITEEASAQLMFLQLHLRRHSLMMRMMFGVTLGVHHFIHL
jgi:hypothetical protein